MLPFKIFNPGAGILAHFDFIYICLFTYTIGYKLHYFVHELIDVYERSHRSRSCCSLNPMGLSILYCVINSYLSFQFNNFNSDQEGNLTFYLIYFIKGDKWVIGCAKYGC